MDIKVATVSPDSVKADAVIVSHFDGKKSLSGEAAVVDKALGGIILSLVKSGEIKGKLNETTFIHTYNKIPAKRVVVLGLGKEADLTADKVRSCFAAVCRALRKKSTGSIAIPALGAGVNGISEEASGQALAEGAILGLYTFRKHQTKEPEFSDIKLITIIKPEKGAATGLKNGINIGSVLAEATNTARDMVNSPSNYMTPTNMAEIALSVAKDNGLEIDILEREQAQELGMGAFLNVAKGSEEPPKFIVMNYKGGSTNVIDLAIIGKAITFDSGGISLKPADGMEEMKGDMAGGAAVISAMGAIAQLKPRINILAIVAATENLPGGKAFKPGDVLKSLSGKTIEVISTDAEGRLTLADALGYAKKRGAKQIVDIATLTGACRIALGDVCTGAFTNNQKLADAVIAAGAQAGERIWQMPMYDEYKDQNKSEVADIKNTGGRLAGAITAAHFVGEFAGDTPWVHLDIAGTNMSDKEKGPNIKGATGVTVRTLANLAVSFSKK